VTRSDLNLPSYEGAELVVPAPAPGPGSWAGAASAVLVDGVFWLAYRERRPLQDGRGVAVVVARSRDGVRLEEVVRIDRGDLGAESLERPALVALPDGGWRLYLSCATPGSRHWWVHSLTAHALDQMASATGQVVLPGDRHVGVKDPVIEVGPDGWRAWLCCHPLDEPGEEDRMTTRLLRSTDGLSWTDRGEVLAGRHGRWDARGARVTAVLRHDPLTVLYDGRPDAASNWHETTGVARWDGARLRAVDGASPISSPHGDGAFRYVSVAPLPDGRTRFYAEAARPDGAHDLVTMVR
jgi:hypothetical protein